MKNIKFIKNGQLVKGVAVMNSESYKEDVEGYEIFTADEAECIEDIVKLAVSEFAGYCWDHVRVTAELPGEAHRDLRPDSENGNADEWIKCMTADYVPTSIKGVLRHNYECTGKLYGCYIVNGKNFTIYYK